jgi:hypothetical protein
MEKVSRISFCLTQVLNDWRWKRAQAVSDDVHKSNNTKTETLGGGSSPAIGSVILLPTTSSEYAGPTAL